MLIWVARVVVTVFGRWGGDRGSCARVSCGRNGGGRGW